MKLLRSLEHKSHVMFEPIRPHMLYTALRYLSPREVFRDNNISVDESIMEQYKNNLNPIDFIVDPEDACVFEEVLAAKQSNLESKLNDDQKMSDSSGDSSESDFPIMSKRKHKGNDRKPRKKQATGPKLQTNNEINTFFCFDDDDDDVLLCDLNEELAQNAVISIAPGQNKKPIPWLIYPDIDELAYAPLFNGDKFNKNKVTYPKRVISELRRADRRSCFPERLFFMVKRKQALQLITNINMCLRKVKQTKNIKAGQFLQKGSYSFFNFFFKC